MSKELLGDLFFLAQQLQCEVFAGNDVPVAACDDGFKNALFAAGGDNGLIKVTKLVKSLEE